MAALRSRHAVCILFILLTHQYAEPTPNSRWTTASEVKLRRERDTPWQNFIKRIQKPFRTVDSALLLLGGKNAKPGTDRGLPVSTKSPTTTSTEAPEVKVTLDRLVMDPDRKPTPKTPGVTKPNTTTPSAPLSVDAPTWNLYRLANDPCGSSPVNITDGDRLVGLGQFPWLALLQYTAEDKSVNIFCGGSLINERYVLTAASCLEVYQHKLTSVRLGEYNLEFYEPDCTDVEDGLNDEVSIEACYGEMPVDYEVSSAHAHPKYNTSSGEYNVGLIRLTKKVEYTPLISPVCLPVGDFVLNLNGGMADSNLILAGWGDNVVPREAFTTRADPDDCEDAIGDAITEGQICASGQDGEALCHGDIGGPLVASMRTPTPPRRIPSSSSTGKRYIQLGLLVSKSPDCYESPPIIIDGVERFLSWILRTMKL